jgi:hypothetical protein
MSPSQSSANSNQRVSRSDQIDARPVGPISGRGDRFNPARSWRKPQHPSGSDHATHRSWPLSGVNGGGAASAPAGMARISQPGRSAVSGSAAAMASSAGRGSRRRLASNAESCLVYDRPIRRDGLLWSELAPAGTFRRSFQAIPGEAGRGASGADPAGLPSLRPRRSEAVAPSCCLPRQRMDFLLLPPNDFWKPLIPFPVVPAPLAPVPEVAHDHSAFLAGLGIRLAPGCKISADLPDTWILGALTSPGALPLAERHWRRSL